MIDRIDDEPVRFFLRHRRQIEEWAQLATDAKRLAHQVMIAVGNQLENNPPAGSEVLADTDGHYHARLLYRPDWLGDDGRPVVAAGLVWHATSVDFRPGGNWVGIWRGRRRDPDPVVDDLRSALAGLASNLGLKSKGWSEWPMYKRAPAPSGEFWDDLRPWLHELDDAVRSIWEGTADELGVFIKTVNRSHGSH